MEERDLLKINFDNIPKKINRWEKEEVEFLKVNWNAMAVEQIAEELKRTYKSVYMKARPLKMPNHSPWTKEETDLLIKLYYKGHSRDTMANYINRSSQACGGKVERLIKEGVLSPRTKYRTSC